MAIDKTESNDDSRADARQDTAAKGANEPINRKRRLSKRERKNLKKKKTNLALPQNNVCSSESAVKVSFGVVFLEAFITV